jgi:hypothetical protein
MNKLISSVTYIDFINIKGKGVSAADRNMEIFLEGKYRHWFRNKEVKSIYICPCLMRNMQDKIKCIQICCECGSQI